MRAGKRAEPARVGASATKTRPPVPDAGAVENVARRGSQRPSVARRPGPKYRVTPEKEELVASALVVGAPLKVALAAAGIKPRTWYRHLERRRS
jgi:hypothetical protein